MTTPLNALLDHGREIQCRDALSHDARTHYNDSCNGIWILIERPATTEDELFDETQITSDFLGGSPVALKRYYQWLVEFRRIIEAPAQTNSQKRDALSTLMNSQRYPDITYALGGTDVVIASTFPEYLMYLEDCGVCAHYVQSLRLAGINNRWALAQLDFRGLIDVMHATPGSDSPLYQHWQSVRLIINNAPGDDALLLANLADPVIQTLY